MTGDLTIDEVAWALLVFAGAVVITFISGAVTTLILIHMSDYLKNRGITPSKDWRTLISQYFRERA